jgi:hypothetical protein
MEIAEKMVLEAFERGKAFGFAEGMKSMRLKELTDEEIQEIIKQQDWFSMSWVDMVRRIESKIRNG